MILISESAQNSQSFRKIYKWKWRQQPMSIAMISINWLTFSHMTKMYNSKWSTTLTAIKSTTKQKRCSFQWLDSNHGDNKRFHYKYSSHQEIIKIFHLFNESNKLCSQNAISIYFWYSPTRIIFPFKRWNFEISPFKKMWQNTPPSQKKFHSISSGNVHSFYNMSKYIEWLLLMKSVKWAIELHTIFF